MTGSNQEYRELTARIEDNISASEGGMLTATKFLSPAEGYYAEKFLASRGIKRGILYGGFDGAERCRLIVLPAYLDGLDPSPAELLKEYFADESDGLVRAVKIVGSGYRELSHRDYLGSILALGVEREAVGDIVVSDSRTAYVFVIDSVAKLMISGLERIGNDKVKVEMVAIDENFTFKREFRSLSDTVASARFDCVVSSLANLSRDKAQNLIGSGVCLLNYAEEIKCDKTVRNGDIITLRGYGKFIIRDINTQTKKGRLRLLADKYV